LGAAKAALRQDKIDKRAAKQEQVAAKQEQREAQRQRREQEQQVQAARAAELDELQVRLAAVTTRRSEKGLLQKRKRLEDEASGTTRKRKGAPLLSMAERRRLNRAREAAEALEEMVARQAEHLAREQSRAGRLEKRQRQASWCRSGLQVALISANMTLIL
jgi:hypothetical protein